MNATRFHIALAAANVLLLGGLVLTQATAAADPAVPDVLRARLIELVNPDGEMRAQLHIAANGGGELRLRGPEGEIRVKLGATDDGAILLMLDGATEPGVRLATDSPGPSLRLVDKVKGEKLVAP